MATPKAPRCEESISILVFGKVEELIKLRNLVLSRKNSSVSYRHFTTATQEERLEEKETGVRGMRGSGEEEKDLALACIFLSPSFCHLQKKRLLLLCWRFTRFFSPSALAGLSFFKFPSCLLFISFSSSFFPLKVEILFALFFAFPLVSSRTSGREKFQ